MTADLLTVTSQSVVVPSVAAWDLPTWRPIASELACILPGCRGVSMAHEMWTLAWQVLAKLPYSVGSWRNTTLAGADRRLSTSETLCPVLLWGPH